MSTKKTCQHTKFEAHVNYKPIWHTDGPQLPNGLLLLSLCPYPHPNPKCIHQKTLLALFFLDEMEWYGDVRVVGTH